MCPYSLWFENAIAYSQRFSSDIIKEEEVHKTYNWLDNIAVCGSSLEVHDKNLEHFLTSVNL